MFLHHPIRKKSDFNLFRLIAQPYLGVVAHVPLAAAVGAAVVVVFLFDPVSSVCDVDHVLGERGELVDQPLALHLVQDPPLVVIPTAFGHG